MDKSFLGTVETPTAFCARQSLQNYNVSLKISADSIKAIETLELLFNIRPDKDMYCAPLHLTLVQ